MSQSKQPNLVNKSANYSQMYAALGSIISYNWTLSSDNAFKIIQCFKDKANKYYASKAL